MENFGNLLVLRAFSLLVIWSKTKKTASPADVTNRTITWWPASNFIYKWKLRPIYMWLRPFCGQIFHFSAKFEVRNKKFQTLWSENFSHFQLWWPQWNWLSSPTIWMIWKFFISINFNLNLCKFYQSPLTKLVVLLI